MAGIQCKPLPPLTTKNIARYWAKIDKRGLEDCWLWTAHTAKGYGQISVAQGRRVILAHRVAYFLGHGVDPAPFLVCHTCDVRNCCNPAHLWLGTNTDNMRDAVLKGRRDSIFVSRPSKLKESDVIEIRKLHASGLWLYRELATKFGVAYGHIYEIVKRERWKHLP